MAKYKITKENNQKTARIKETKNKGYRFAPKKNIKDGVKVNSLFIMKPSFITKVLKRKDQIRLDYYLQYLIDETDSTTDGGHLGIVLNDLSKYHDMIEYKYRKYLDDKYIDLLLKKITLLEHELKNKILYQQWKEYSNKTYVPEETKGKAR